MGAATLSNHEILEYGGAVIMSWGQDDGFPYGCGPKPTIQAQLCIVEDVVPVVDESYCDKACNGFADDTVDTSFAKCFKSANKTYSDSVWSSGINWSSDKTDANFITLNKAAVSHVNSGEEIIAFRLIRSFHRVYQRVVTGRSR